MKLSLAWKWVIASLLIESLMLSLMVYKNVTQLENNLSEQTVIRLNMQKVLLQSALAAPLAQMDYATIDAILKETKEIPNIDYLAVIDNQKNCISSVGIADCTKLPNAEDNPFSKQSLEDQKFDTNIPIILISQNLGKVYLGLSTKFYVQARKDMINRSILIAAIELILSAILLLAISKWITKNLVRLTHLANAISKGDYNQKIRLSDNSEETSSLQTALNLMVSNIKTNIEELEASYKEQKSLSCELKSQLEKNHKQDILLEHQSRMAALGEMLSNIAHQWRQPLNAITVQLSSMKLQNELKLLSDKEINEIADDVIKYANYLSHTIDDFRNFIKIDKLKKKFCVQQSFTQAKNIVSANLLSNYITLEIAPNEEKLYTNGIMNELTQVFINILNNAKDVFAEHEMKSKVIRVAFSKIENEIHITIHDNGGGINDEIKEKIFDPYFTTKHKSQGTGIGLYMSSKIINEHFEGEIFVENEEISFLDEKYLGAKFYIILPVYEDNIEQ